MTFFEAISKLLKRKKINGYYEASSILTPKEKQSLIIGFSIIIIPIIICLLLLILN
ncbi:hypothetical protein [Anaerosalibacter bizertensis]|uniref:hypothetical protein n=1 Tax=Anaerosalibacter bizertensis TaxID=932217 RepID=UPI001D02A6FB|nr:hypothetical protein [Anaerosalibacter bizertensis]MBV1821808.1 hypothetical protein [Bacteroidales bacterium MSK.15.36]MCB5560419.1 hypothetical protein [Anaerosalibacter bizertensis]MCG4584118.1 hypothetical protein [Anaerosalibacter bizertensis]